MSSVFEDDGDSIRLAHDMIALGIRIEAYEEAFLSAGGDVDDSFHEAWEAAVDRWWDLASLANQAYDTSGNEGAAILMGASIAAMTRPISASVLTA